MPAPEVFAFVPSYNHAPFVERCLRSIFKQTVQPAKLLVIDDGSRDDSVQVIEKTLRDCPFPAEFVHRENRGLCRTLNEGFANSFGKYFAYLGSDDVWLPEFLENRVRQLEERPAAVLGYGHAYKIDAFDNIVENSADWAEYADGDALPMLLGGNAPFSPTVCYRREVLATERWNDQARLEDYDLYLRLSRKGEFAFDSQTLAAWRQHDTNTSHDWRMMLDEVLAAQQRNFAVMDISETELKRACAAAKLLYSEMFARTGDKRTALSLLTRNLSAADSTAFVVKSFLRLLAPQAVIKRRQQREKAKVTQRYGKLPI
jgi:alpha-1,3-rhamnosyltransferase